jgi:ribonuclease P protein component
MLPKNIRLSNSSDFYSVSKYGKFSSNNFWSIKYLPSSEFSISVIVSKKVSTKATIRNRIKRRTKSLISSLKSAPKYKILVFPKYKVLKHNYPLLKVEFETLFKPLM